jgi:2-keto-4-pentenoate hydratase/2-oxohepta-3-ene-1,7-dioic acid hydratase in catechol pathway
MRLGLAEAGGGPLLIAQRGQVVVSLGGAGFAHKPPLFMKHGDVCEIEVEGIGLLRNPIVDEQAA